MKNPKDTSALLLPPVSAAAQGPLYEQVIARIKTALGEERLHPGDMMPSIRTLAADLRVSLITVKRAYEELEREKIIYRKQGLGTFVSSNGVARSRAVQRRQAEELIEEAVEHAIDAGMSKAEVLATVRRRFEVKEG